MGSHEKTREGETNEWYTPQHILDALGPFTLDPCTSERRPWNTATLHFTDRGLERTWIGFVWCNPPYGPHAWRWLSKLAEHGNGIALIFARTETKGFFDEVWSKADALLFLRGRLKFHRHDLAATTSNAGAPSVLVAYGETAVERLKSSELDGVLIESWLHL